MKKLLAFLILACLVVTDVSYIDTKKKDDENGTNAVVTDAGGSVVTDEKGDPETYEAEETTTGEKSTGNWNFETDGDGENWGGLIPIG